jgi:hypothetical protein
VVKKGENDMNQVIRTLLETKENEESKLKEQQHVVKTLEESLRTEIYKETRLLNEVLKNNLIQIIEMIHKNGLKCSSVQNAETIWHDTVYKVSDGNYFVNICAKDGKIVADYEGINNDGGGKRLAHDVDLLINPTLTMFCDREKSKYADKV